MSKAPSESKHELQPGRYDSHTVFGVVTSGGKPLAGVTLTIVKKEDSAPLQDDGQYVLHMYEDNYGPSPHTLTFSKAGYKSQTHTVTFTKKKEQNKGVELNIELVPEP